MSLLICHFIMFGVLKYFLSLFHYPLLFFYVILLLILYATFSTTQKQDRPWRVRLADAARLRSVHGDDVGGVCSSLIASRARRSSITSQNSGDELQSSLSALRSYVDNSAVVGFRCSFYITLTRPHRTNV